MRLVLDALEGGQSATNVHAWIQYIYGVPIVATIDLDAPDSHLVQADHEQRSRWLCRNCDILRLSPGEAFYCKESAPKAKLTNTYSLFAQTLQKRRRLGGTFSVEAPVREPWTPQRSVGPPLEWAEEDVEEECPDEP